MELEQKIIEAVQPYLGLPLALSGGVDSSLLAALIKPKFAITVDVPGNQRYSELAWAKLVAEYLKIEHVVVEIDDSKFDEYMTLAVKAIGRPIPHFNIFPLFCMYKKLAEMGETRLILGDGPDETMCGYARDLIADYLYKVYDFEAFTEYRPMIDKILPSLQETIQLVTGKEADTMQDANIKLMRPDMDDMSNGIAEYFGIKNHRPYQDNTELDNYMRDLPIEEKICDVEYGKFALRKVAENYLPYAIAWRKKKVGGPVFPVNLLKGWDKTDGEFGKKSYLNYQSNILHGN